MLDFFNEIIEYDDLSEEHAGLEKIPISQGLVTLFSLLHIYGVIPTMHSAILPKTPCRASLQSMIKVANISLFIYIGSPGLRPNRHQDLVATEVENKQLSL